MGALGRASRPGGAEEDETPSFVTLRVYSRVSAASTALSVNAVSDSVSSSHSCAGTVE